MSFMVRMSILGFLLIVALCGLAYEFLVAVPGFNNAQAKLTEIADANIRKTIEEAATMEDVKAILPQAPSESNVIKPPKKTGEDDVSMRAMTFIRQDKYKFFHALPWKKPETIVVVYQKVLKSEEELDADTDSFDAADWRLRTVHFNTEPPKTAQRNVSKDAKNPGDVPMAAGGGRGPSGGGGGPGQGGPGKGGPGKGGKGAGKRPDPETIFKENDKDKDGKLTGDEIPERMRRFVDNMDEDKDGAITIEEMKAAMARAGQRGGGRGGRGGPGGDKKGGRPSFDEDKGKTEEKSEKKTEAKAEEKKADPKAEEKTTDPKTEEKTESNSEKKSEEKAVEKKAEETTEAKAEEKADDKAEEKTEEKVEEKKTEEKK